MMFTALQSPASLVPLSCRQAVMYECMCDLDGNVVDDHLVGFLMEQLAQAITAMHGNSQNQETRMRCRSLSSLLKGPFVSVRRYLECFAYTLHQAYNLWCYFKFLKKGKTHYAIPYPLSGVKLTISYLYTMSLLFLVKSALQVWPCLCLIQLEVVGWLGVLSCSAEDTELFESWGIFPFQVTAKLNVTRCEN